MPRASGGERNAPRARIDRQAFELNFTFVRLHRAREQVRDRRLPGTGLAAQYADAALELKFGAELKVAQLFSESSAQHE